MYRVELHLHDIMQQGTQTNTKRPTSISWRKSKNEMSLMLGIPAPYCVDQWCSDSCPLEAKHTDTIFNVVRQIAYIHGRSQYY
jgi:hypothetical protein